MAQQKTILIIDDDNDLRGALMEQLELHQEFKAVEAINATEGLKLAREVRADLILLDVDLPDMDGRETCRLIRKGGIATPIVMNGKLYTVVRADADLLQGPRDEHLVVAEGRLVG